MWLLLWKFSCHYVWAAEAMETDTRNEKAVHASLTYVTIIGAANKAIYLSILLTLNSECKTFYVEQKKHNNSSNCL